MPDMDRAQFSDNMEPQPPRDSSRFIIVFGIAAILLIILGTYFWRSRIATEAVPDTSSLESGKLSTGFKSLGVLKDASFGAFGILGDLDSLLTNLPKLLLSGRGEDALSLLKSIRDRLGLIQAALKEGPGGLALHFLPEDIFSGLENGRELLDAILTWADTGEKRRLLILFANTSELRPGGGFTGSFAEVVLNRGSIESINMYDVNESDRKLEANIVPPKPLQAIVGRWRAADANWFFNFPTSAEKTLTLIERSGFTPKEVRYDGVIALTPEVLADILEETGPLILQSGKVIDKDNFLFSIQEEVQAGQAEGSIAPKAVLSEILTTLQEKLVEKDGTALLSKFPQWIEERYLMTYMRDGRIAKGLKSLGADGSLYEIPDKFEGEYLAVVHANIGGGKTDIVMRDTVSLKSELQRDGLVSNELLVQREHRGGERSEWWYQVPNWDYLQVFVPDGAELAAAEGAGIRNINPKADYKKGFETDPDIFNLEQNARRSSSNNVEMFRYSGREVFANWMRIPEGESRTLKISYTRKLSSPLKSGDQYVFVYEAQQGGRAALDLILTAPPGLIWSDSGSPVYEYNSQDPPGRIILNLTLQKR